MEATQHEQAISWELSESEVPLPVAMHAAYRFIDRCFVAVEAAGEGSIRVTLVARDEVAGPEAWEALRNDFEDEVVGEKLVTEVEAQRISNMEFVMAQALGETKHWEEEEGSDDALDDPLGIAMSWEERHAKPQPETATEVPDEAKGPAAATEEE